MERGERLRSIFGQDEKLRSIRLLCGKLGGDGLLRARENGKVHNAFLLPCGEEREERLEIESAAERVVGLQKRSGDGFAVLWDRDAQNVPRGIERADERRVGVNFGGCQEKGPAKGVLFQKRGVFCHRPGVCKREIDRRGRLLGLRVRRLLGIFGCVRLIAGGISLGLGGVHLLDAVADEALGLFDEQGVVVHLAAGRKAEDGVTVFAL